MALSGVGIVFGNIQEEAPQSLTETATALGASICHAELASQAQFLVASNVLKTADGRDPYLVRALSLLYRDGAPFSRPVRWGD